MSTRFLAATNELSDFILYDDFDGVVPSSAWTDTLTDSGTATINDGQSGILTLVASDGSVADNDEAYRATAKELFLVEYDKRLYFKSKIKFVEANTDDANVVAGFMSAVGANALVDNGAGLRTSGNYFCIYKVDGETVWRAGCRNGTDVFTTTSTTTAGGSSYQTLEIFVNYVSATEAYVYYRVDGSYLTNGGSAIRHTLPISGSTEMQAFVGLKNGGMNLETLLVDYVYATRQR